MTYGRHPYGGVGYAGADVADISQADTQTALSIEVAFTTGALETPVWEDITADVRSWDTSRGRRRELERFQPGRATIVLSNLSRQYDSAYADGPHFGNLRPMRRVRIRETFNGVTYPVFDGFVDRWHLDYPGMGHDATATITATDAMKVVARTDLPKSVYAQAVLDSGAQTYWRLDEGIDGLAEGVVVNAGLGGVAKDGAYTGSPGVGAQGLVVADPGKSMTVFDTNVFDGATLQGATISNTALNLLTPATTRVFTVEAWVRMLEGSNEAVSSVTGVLCRVSEEGTNNIHSSILYRDDGTGAERRFEFSVLNSAGSNVYGVRTPDGSVIPGQIHHVVAVVESGGQMAIYLDGTRYTDATGFTAGSLSGITVSTTGRITVGYDGTSSAGAVDNFGGDIDDISFYEGIALAQADVTAHYLAGTAPWQDDLGGARADRILDMVDWPEDLRELDTGLTALQSAVLDTPALEHLQKIGETEFGLLFIDRAGRVRFIDRHGVFARLPAVEVYGDDVGVREFRPDDGDDNIRNRSRISRLNGAVRTSTDATSVDEFGRFDYTLDGLLHRTEQYSQDYANLITGEYHEPRRRITALSLGPPIPGEEDVVIPAMLGRELGDAILVSNQPEAGGDPFTQTCVIEGIEHKSQPGGDRTTRFILSPEFTAREWEDTMQIGYAQVTANQGSITTTADLTSLTATVTVGADRYIRVTGHVRSFSSTLADDRVLFHIREGSTTLGSILLPSDPGGGNAGSGGQVVWVGDSPSAGSHTYKLSAESADGGTVTMNAAATFPAFILVEDIGPA